VSTCNRGKTALFFCSVPCFQAHVPTLRHRDAWAEEQRAPTESEWAEQRAREEAAERAQAQTEETRTPHAVTKELRMSNEVTKETLIVVSKVKAYIRQTASMNTSDAVTEALSELVRNAADQAVAKAKADGRKTVMARDIPGAPQTSE
jgi:histone H3/H4